jgi:Ser/Thr protein kinase RdoA (MazF antagonist)
VDVPQLIESELAWLAALRRDTGLAVPEPLRAASGASITLGQAHGVEPRVCSAMRWIGGRIRTHDAVPAQLELVGALTAQLHNHAAAWAVPPGFARVRWDWHAFFGDTALFAGLGVEAAWELISPAHRPAFARASERLRAAMDDLGDGSEAFGLIHADLHLDNVLFAGGEAHAIDFDDCGFGHWVYDIAVALWPLRGRDAWPAYRDAFLAGYARHRPVPAGQLRHLDAFIAGRDAMIGLWLAAEAQVNPSFREELEEDLAGIVDLVGRLLGG